MDDLFDINEDFADVELNLGLDDPQPETIPQQDLPLLETKLTTESSSTSTQQTNPPTNDTIPPSSTYLNPPQPQQEEPKLIPLPKPKPKIPYAIEDKIDLSEYTKISPLALTFPFTLDPFQQRGIIRVENHQHVLVCAHTSSGKTLVAEYAIAKSKSLNKRIIYTSPIKALSNQKFRDFKAKFNNDVGIITGDVCINPDAQCIIMTTEILKNWLYKQNEKLKMVDYIIFDEVHYINDRERGHVWEEILILLPNTIGLVMLSATIPNYMQFAQWIGSIKQTTVYVEITYKRVVPLEHKCFISAKQVFMFKDKDGKVKDDEVHKAIKAAEDNQSKTFANRKKPQNKKERQEREQKLSHQIKQYTKFLMKKEQERFNNDNNNNSNNDNSNSNRLITQTHLKIEETVNYVIKEKLTPCVMFTFSIRKIDEYARMLSHNQYITRDESTRVTNFFMKCINKLDAFDRQIGQIQAMKLLLQSGVGVHHSGLLPILKEIVEILYSKGLIKILFATTSFSIGLNMPTKTVVFTEITKYNDGVKGVLSSSEYLQMCGRAGRRGIDDKGNVLIMLGDQRYPPKPSDIITMAKGEGTEVASQFRLEYKTIINFYYRNVKNIVQFFKESYIEHNTYISMPEIRKNIEQLNQQLHSFPVIECASSSTQQQCEYNDIVNYYTAKTQYKAVSSKLYDNDCINALLLTNGRVLIINSKTYRKNIPVVLVKYYVDYDGELWCLTVDDNKQTVIQYENVTKTHYTTRYGVLNGKYYLYFKIFTEDIVDITDTVIKSVPKENAMDQDEDGFHFYKKKDLELVLTELLTLSHQYQQQQQPNIHVVNYLKVSKNNIDVSELLKRKNELYTTLNANKCHTCEQREKHLKEYSDKKAIEDKLTKCKTKLKEESIKCYKEFTQRLKILQELDYLDNEMNLQLKGKAAKEISSSDSLLVTEVLLSNITNELSVDEIIAFFSGFITNKNGVDLSDPNISEGFTKAISSMKEIIKKVDEVEHKFNFEESKYNRRFCFSLAKSLQMWMQGKHFNEILDECDVEEGKVFSVINRLSLFLDSVCEFYNVIGNTTLGEKFVKAKEVLLREIMACKSLYLEEDIDVDNI